MSIEKDWFGNGSKVMDGINKIGSISNDGEVKDAFGNVVGHVVQEFGKTVLKGAFNFTKEFTEETLKGLIKGSWR